MSPSRQLLPTLGLVGGLLLVVALLLLAAQRTPAPPSREESPPGVVASSPGASAATTPPTPAPGEVVPAPSFTLPTGVPEQACRPQPATVRFTVVSFNIHSARTGAGVRLDQVATEIAAMRADAVLLQEVDRGRAVTGRLDMPAILAERLGMHFAFGTNVQSGSEQYGTALLSRHPIVAAANHPLPHEPGRQRRGLLHAVLDVGGMALSVYNTHLEFARGGLKERQMQAVAAAVGEDPRPRILGGDLNAKPGSSVVDLALSVATDPWPTVGKGSPATSPADDPAGRIDYLLYAGPGLEPLWADIPATAVSDHRPVRTHFQLAGYTGCVPVG